MHRCFLVSMLLGVLYHRTVTLWGHIRLGDWSNAFVYAWHIPLFFFLSGMVFNKSKYASFQVFLLKKVKSLLVPYVIFSFLTWIIWAAYSYSTHAHIDSYWMPLAQTFIAQGSGGFLLHNVPLWFVTCLFMMEVIYYFISSWNKLLIIVSTLLMAAISWVMITQVRTVDVTLLPWNLEVVFLGIPLFAAGHLLVQKVGHQQMQNWVNQHRITSLLLVIGLAAFVLVGSHYNGSISFGHADIHNPLITYPCAFMGVFMILLICMLLASTKACENNVVWMKWLKWFGRNSFTAMAIHNPIKGIVCVVVGIVLGCGSTQVSQSDSYAFVAFVVTLTTTVVGICITNWIKNKLKN